MPTEGSLPALASRALHLIEMYWAPRSEFDAMLPGGDRIAAAPVILKICAYRSKPKPMRKVWKDSFRSMLTPLDGAAQREQEVDKLKVLV